MANEFEPIDFVNGSKPYISAENLNKLQKRINSTMLSNLNEKQDNLESGTNIKTVNGKSLLGEGDITIDGGSSGDGRTILELVTIASGTTLSVFDGLTDETITANIITVPEYTIGDNKLEIFEEGHKWTKANITYEISDKTYSLTSIINDGQYVEWGTDGEKSTQVLIFRTTDDGEYTLTEDLILEVIVRGITEEG